MYVKWFLNPKPKLTENDNIYTHRVLNPIFFLLCSQTINSKEKLHKFQYFPIYGALLKKISHIAV